jgi:hypothetical protein
MPIEDYWRGVGGVPGRFPADAREVQRARRGASRAEGNRQQQPIGYCRRLRAGGQARTNAEVLTKGGPAGGGPNAMTLTQRILGSVVSAWRYPVSAHLRAPTEE